MENDVGLDDLILKDRQDRKKERQERGKANRTKRIEKNYRRDDHRDRQRGGRNHHNRDNQRRQRFEDRFQDKRNVQENRGHTLLIKGFVADVSTQDIFKLLKGKKIYKISTFLENESRSIIEYQKGMTLDVKIKFQNQEDVDDFMQQFSKKVFDGKNSLTFSFVRS